MQIRHNLVVLGEALLSSGRLCHENGIPSWWRLKRTRFFRMKRAKLGLAAGLMAAWRRAPPWRPRCGRMPATPCRAGGAGRPGRACRASSSILPCGTSPPSLHDNIEAALAAGDCGSRQQFCRTRAGQGHRARRRSVEAGQRRGGGRQFHRADSQNVLPPVSSPAMPTMLPACPARCRRSLRVRRHQGRRARGQASRDGRGDRSSHTRARHGGPCRDRGDLRLRRRRRAAARRA